jgi:hypothetical protein
MADYSDEKLNELIRARKEKTQEELTEAAREFILSKVGMSPKIVNPIKLQGKKKKKNK